MAKKKPLKIGKRTVKNDFESKGYLDLCSRVGKHLVEYETEKLPYTVDSNYTPDFIVYLSDGRKLYLEYKGNGRAFDQSVRTKMIAVKKQHPDKDIRIVFYSDGKIGPKRKDGTCLRQSDWAQKNGFIFAIGRAPDEWFT